MGQNRLPEQGGLSAECGGSGTMRVLPMPIQLHVWQFSDSCAVVGLYRLF